jgi:hypothetical protein
MSVEHVARMRDEKFGKSEGKGNHLEEVYIEGSTSRRILNSWRMCVWILRVLN